MDKVRFERDGALGVLTLADPPLNLVGTEVVDGLEHAIEEAEQADVRAMLVRAEGDNFSAGAQVADMFQGRSSSEARALLQRVARSLARAEALPYPSVAAVQGLCLAGGFEVALACDLIVAARSAQLGLVEAVIGAIPFGGGAQRIAERAGSARAKEAVFTAAVLPAETWERWNVVNRVVPDDELGDLALELARRLAAGPTRAHAATRRVLRAHLDGGMRAADACIADVAPSLFETRDMQGGIVSLLAEGPGKAKFSGQ